MAMALQGVKSMCLREKILSLYQNTVVDDLFVIIVCAFFVYFDDIFELEGQLNIRLPIGALLYK
jgi:hypothetical protein